MWLTLPLTGLSLAYVLGYPPATADGYDLAATGSATISLGFISPVVAGVCAWEAGRLRRAQWWSFPWLRGRAVMVLATSALPVAVGIGALVVTAIANSAVVGASLPDVRVLLASSAAIAAAGVVGCALGVLLPPVASAPTALLGIYLWTAYPRALEPLWLRHLNGSFASCCALDADLGTGPWAASILVALAIVVAAVTAIGERLSAQRVAASAAFCLAAVAVAVALVVPFGPDPAVPRERSALRCAGDHPRVCLWPEHEAQRSVLVMAADAAVEGWEQLGVGIPGRLSESPAGDELLLNFSRESSQWDIVHSLGYSYVARHCGGDASSSELVNAWLDAAAGMPSGELGQRYDYPPAPGETATLIALRSIRSLQPVAQSEWFASVCR